MTPFFIGIILGFTKIELRQKRQTTFISRNKDQ